MTCTNGILMYILFIARQIEEASIWKGVAEACTPMKGTLRVLLFASTLGRSVYVKANSRRKCREKADKVHQKNPWGKHRDAAIVTSETESRRVPCWRRWQRAHAFIIHCIDFILQLSVKCQCAHSVQLKYSEDVFLQDVLAEF